jgi:hypothetical protein
MLLDNLSATAQNTVKNWISAISNQIRNGKKEKIQILKSWKATNNLDDITSLINLYLKNTFEDELGKRQF